MTESGNFAPFLNQISAAILVSRGAHRTSLVFAPIITMDMQRVAKYIESARLYALGSPVYTAVATVAIAGAVHMLSGYQCCLNVKPEESIIVITGCDTGFGLMTCKKLSSMGYVVVAACLLQQSVKDLENVVALPIQCDITKEEDRNRLLAKVQELEQSRNARLWTLVNNAGIANSGGIDWVPSAACRKVMEVNFFGLFEVTRAFLPLLKRTKNSRIINISSAAGLVGSFHMGVYCGKHLKCCSTPPWNDFSISLLFPSVEARCGGPGQDS
jgi:hypothetical protein